MSFVHLHTHSHYSLLDGVPKVEDLVQAAKDAGMTALALTDHGNMYGAIELYQSAQEHGITPIIGIEAYIAPKSIEVREPKERPFHMILLAKNNTGYENLIRLTSVAHTKGYYGKPRIDMELLRQFHEGLIALSGCLSGEVARAITQHSLEKATEVAKRYNELFGNDHFYLEVQHNPNTPEQAVVNKGLLAIHTATGIPLVATNDAHYIRPEDAEAQDVMVCIQTKRLLAETNRMTMRNEDYSLSTPEQMIERFQDFPEAVENTQRIADRIDTNIELGKIQIPYFDVPLGSTPERYLRQLCEEGLTERYKNSTPEIQERLEYELGVIEKTGFASYFLIVQDFVNWAKKQGIAVGPGRGSAAGSIVSYLTNITDVDPVKYELLFERFLNPERVSQPDIDIDFADSRREDVLKYVEQRYGKNNVAQIITFGTLAARAAIRDVGRVLGLSYGYCDRLAKLIPMFATLDQAIDQVPELQQLVNQDADAERLISIAKKLEGAVRHTSTHACAVVITKEPLDTQVPLQTDQDGAVITQYSMHPIESLGLLKMDFLGLKNLTIIEDTLNIVRATTEDDIKIEQIPLDDKKTFKLLQRAETIGVFQLESSGMRRYLKQLKPTEMEDIIAMVSLYRPGPMEFIPDYISGKHGKREITYIEPRLEPILKKTYGIAVYQEQVMEIARRLAGYSYGEADVLRKAVGKKIKSLLDEQEQRMINGMVKNGISSAVAKQIWEFILPFARYGFNRSHAACYAMIAYRTAYLKANYPAQFMAALLTADHGNTERVAFEITHAEQMGLKVLPPDINESFGTFTVVVDSTNDETRRIRFGLNAIKNVGQHIVDVIIAERKASGPYSSIENFLQRVKDKDLNKKSLESLIKVGALDSLGERNQLLINIEMLLQFAKRSQQEDVTGQANLFGALPAADLPAITLSPTPSADRRLLLEWEKQLLGIYLTGHPLDEYKELLERISTPFATLKDQPKNRRITLVGMVAGVKRITTKKGEPMVFAAFADHTAEIEALVFPSVLKETATLWVENTVLELLGKLDDKDGQLKLLVEEAVRIDPEAKQHQKATVLVSVPKQIEKSLFASLQSLLHASSGRYSVFLQVDEGRIDTKSTVDDDTLEKIAQLFGREAVTVIE